uniref:Uncharacterized protein n=1 Tax=Desulfovibrio sp. U5L TaxID=596152 RepID=I2Q091_9BACT
MGNQPTDLDLSIYLHSFLFLVFILVLARLHWKMDSVPRLILVAIKYIAISFIFLFLFLNWASDVNPSLRNGSLYIITAINFYMLWSVILTAFEYPYRKALKRCVTDVCTGLDLENAFSTGARYYKLRYFWTSLTSGISPWKFTHAVAAERTRNDLHHLFISLDPETSIFGSRLYAQFLRHKLAQEKGLPPEKRVVAEKTIDALENDKWLREQTTQFLDHLLANPEELLEAGLKESLRHEGRLA